jgi:uncharacterized protein (DUF433 family)
MMGKPVILGTRIPVELILRKLSEKATEADLLEAYPQLAAEDMGRGQIKGRTLLTFRRTRLP